MCCDATAIHDFKQMKVYELHTNPVNGHVTNNQ